MTSILFLQLIKKKFFTFEPLFCWKIETASKYLKYFSFISLFTLDKIFGKFFIAKFFSKGLLLFKKSSYKGNNSSSVIFSPTIFDIS